LAARSKEVKINKNQAPNPNQKNNFKKRKLQFSKLLFGWDLALVVCGLLF
jgi:hypothetical protein